MRIRLRNWGLDLPALLVVCSVAGPASPAIAQERVLDYHSEIAIHANASMNVVETIRVQAEGNRIQRGIFRDFPTNYRDQYGNRMVVGFDVIGVNRNGAPEPWFTERIGNGVRLYIGSRNRMIEPGEHTYAIEYRTTWQLGFFETHDELYWNVNGNGWDFSIENISARVTLSAEAGADNITMEGWVGTYGSTDTSVQPRVESGTSANISATRTLAPRESLTFAMTWPKGIVTAPTATEKVGRLLFSNRGLLIALIGFALSLFYWLRVWHAHGRDPEQGTIFPHYGPPENVSPATARYLLRMGYDQKAFSAALINLAVKGYVEIIEDDGDYSLRRTGTGTEALAPGEQAVIESLFADGDLLELDNENHATVQAAMSTHKASLKRDNYKIHFRTNGIYALPANGILLLTIIPIVLLRALSPFAIGIVIVTLLMIPLFFYLMRAHTPAGRRLLDRIEGFRLYLDVAEKDELNLKNPPQITPELFESFLPYALALGVEQRWAERFNDGLPAEQAAHYQPAWYHGNWTGHGGVSNIGAATAAVTGAVATSIAAAATPPGSSSGSSIGGGGGGFSGGGGGGGGGGGW